MCSRRRRLAVLVAIAAMGIAACGRGDPRPLVAPVALPANIVPAIVAGDLTTHEFDPARSTFAKVGASSLIADGKVWAIRRGETLVGTLQVSTVKPDISFANPADRKAVLQGVMTGISYETIDVGDTQVAASTAADKTLYVWFGPTFFEVLQVKTTKVDPDTVAADLIEYQQSTGTLTKR